MQETPIATLVRAAWLSAAVDTLVKILRDAAATGSRLTRWPTCSRKSMPIGASEQLIGLEEQRQPALLHEVLHSAITQGPAQVSADTAQRITSAVK
jgi:hypothetical protein